MKLNYVILRKTINDIRAEGAKKISESLMTNKSLTMLDIHCYKDKKYEYYGIQ